MNHTLIARVAGKSRKISLPGLSDGRDLAVDEGRRSAQGFEPPQLDFEISYENWGPTRR